MERSLRDGLEAGEGDRPSPKSWLESEEAKGALLAVGVGKLGLIEPWKKLSVISITLSLSLSEVEAAEREGEKGRDLGSEAGIVVGIHTPEETNRVAIVVICFEYFIYRKVRFTPRRPQRPTISQFGGSMELDTRLKIRFVYARKNK